MSFDTDYWKDELFLTKMSMACSAIFGLIALIVLIKICRGSRHPFFIKLVILELVGLFLIVLRELSYIVAYS